MGKLVMCILICVGVTGCNATPRAEFKVPPEFANLRNPIPATPESVAEGKRHYSGGDCAICHGKNGDGKGFLAKDVHMNVHNWRDPSGFATFTDGDLFYIIDQGKDSGNGRMPSYHKQDTPEQIWEMIIYVRSLRNAQAGSGQSD